jgi:hypothetical protein
MGATFSATIRTEVVLLLLATSVQGTLSIFKYNLRLDDRCLALGQVADVGLYHGGGGIV